MKGETPGAMIRRARHEAGLTQAELAEKLKVHKVTVGDWERGRFFPDRHWGALNKILHIRLVPPGAEPEPEPEPDIPADVLEVIRRRYDPEQQREIIAMLEELSALRDAPPAETERSGRGGESGSRRAG